MSLTTLRHNQTEESLHAFIDVIVEATPPQNAQLQACLSRLVTVARLEVEPASDETVWHFVVSVRDDMLDFTRREIQRLATDRCVFLRRCEPIGLDPGFLPKGRGPARFAGPRVSARL